MIFLRDDTLYMRSVERDEGGDVIPTIMSYCDLYMLYNKVKYILYAICTILSSML